MNKRLTCAAVAALSVIALGGCYSYTPVQTGMTGNSFTERDLAVTNEMLSNVKVLSLKKAQEIAVLNNPNYISAYHAVNAARMRYYQALGAFSPTISAQFTMGQNFYDYYNSHSPTTQIGGQGFTTNTGITASWLVFDGMARYFQAKAAEHNYNYYVDMEENARRQLMLSVAYAYNDILLARASREIAINDRDFQHVNLEASQNKLRVGAVAMSEVLNFQIRINQAISSQITAEYAYDTAVFSLAALMGFSDGILPADIEFEDIVVDLNEPIASIDVYLDTALNNRPDLAAYREALAVSKYSLYQTYSAYSPTLTASVGFSFNTSSSKTYKYVHSSGGVTQTYGDTRNYSNSPQLNYGLQADWVIFNGFQRYNATREAQANLAASQFNLAQEWLTVVSEVRTAYTSYVNSVKQARLYAMNLSLTDKQRELVQIEYDNGAVALPRLNEAQSDYVTAEQSHVTALVNVQNAKAQLIAAANIDTTGANWQNQYVLTDSAANPPEKAEATDAK